MPTETQHTTPPAQTPAPQPKAKPKADPNTGPKPRLTHPLCGADLRTIAEVAASAEGISPSGVARLAIAALAASARLPVTLAESLGPGRGGAEASLERPPVFIVGHWRSGTTHLYNVMARSARFSSVPPIATGLPWDFVLLDRFLGPLLRKTLPTDRYIDRIPVNPDSPQEDEIALANMQRLSFYHGLYIPRRIGREIDRGIFLDGATPAEVRRWQRCARRFFAKLERTQPGRALLIKNPVYTARVALLRETFPGAKFIHIHRDPYRVLPSMRNFYEVLFKQLGLGPARTRSGPVDIDAVVIGTYARMMRTLDDETKDLPESDLVTVRFEDFEQDPLGQVRRVYETLGIAGGPESTASPDGADGFEADRPEFERYLESVKGYKKNSYAPDPEIARLVNEHWGEWVDKLGYERHDTTDPAPHDVAQASRL